MSVKTTIAALAGATVLTACGSTVATVTGTSGSGGYPGQSGLGGPVQHGPVAGAASPSNPSGSVPLAATGTGDGHAAGRLATAPALATHTGGHHATAETRGPLTIGFLYPDNGAANAALGVTTSASSNPKTLMSALVAALDHGGGLAGRRVTINYDAIDSTSSDYSTQANAACTHFTQDNSVPVVLDLAFGTRYGMAACLAKHGVADVGFGTSDTTADNAVGLFAAPDWMTSTRRYPAVLAGLHATGYLTSRNKIGVLLENCPYLQRAYREAVLPQISRLGLNLADTEELDCTTGFSSAGPASASVQSAVLRFRSHGVDRLLMVSDYEQVMLLLMANDAESQGWRPGYLLSSAAQTEVMRPNIPSGQWPQLHGIGWSPGLDIDDPHQPLPPADQRCLDLIKNGGVAVAGWQNAYVATTECSDVFLIDAALHHSHGDAQGSALMAAIEALGTTFVAPGILDGRTSFGPTRRDGPAAVAPFGFDPACHCLKYTGRPFTAP